MPSTEEKGHEHRAYPRYQCDIPIKVSTADNAFDGIVLNISLCGALILMDQDNLSACGIVVQLRFRLPGMTADVEVDAYLHRNNESILGVKFLNLKDDDVCWFDQFLQTSSHLETTLATLNKIGIALSSILSLDHLLEMIVVYAKELTHADGGSLYLVIDQRCLRFEIFRNDSLGIALGGISGDRCSFPLIPLYLENGSPDFRTMVSSSILRKRIIRVDDVYDTKRYDFSKTHEFDKRNNYRSQSCLTVPLMFHGEAPIGAIQLVNAIDEETNQIIPFTKDNENLVESLASQAVSAISNHKLNTELKEQLNFHHGLIEVNNLITSDNPWEEKLTGIFEQIATTFHYISRIAGGIFLTRREEANDKDGILEFTKGLSTPQAEFCRQWSIAAKGVNAQNRPLLPSGHSVVAIEYESGYFGAIHILLEEPIASPQRLVDFLNDAGRMLAGVLYCERSKAVIAESEHYLEAILDNALDGILVIDDAGHVLKFNAAVVDMFGYSRDDWQWINLNHIITTPEIIPSFSAVLDSHDEEIREYHDRNQQKRLRCNGRRADGKMIDIDIGMVASRWWDESRITVFLRDVTSEQLLLKSLKDTLGAAEEASKMKSAFLANMSHEIRSPLNAIIGMTDLVLTGSLPREEEVSNLQMVLNAGLSLLDLINDILDLSKIEAGHFALERIPFDLCGRVEDACTTMAIKAHQKSLDLFCDVDWSLPETLAGDPMRLKQILINLINNAIKFTSSGFVAVRVAEATIKPRESGECILHVSVTDTGLGIPANKIEMIFGDFTQVDDSTSRKYGGTGLGLSICQHLVKMMGGDIWVESTMEKGSTFHFTARFGISHRHHERNARPEKEERNTTSDTSLESLVGIRILLGGGHNTNRLILSKMISGFGGTFEEFSDGQSLLSALEGAKNRNLPFDVIVVDEILLREELPDPEALYAGVGYLNPPIVMLPTNMSIASITKHGWLQHASSLKKPIRRFQFINRVNQALGRIASKQQTHAESVIQPRTDTLPMQILLVEDLVTNQRLATSILRQAGHSVVLANHGGEALAILKEKKIAFDLILMDLQMPTMDGFETTMHIRECSTAEIIDPKIPIVAVTACAMISEEEQCRKIGMDGYLRKPYRPNELIQKIEPYLKTKKQPIQKALLEAVDADAETLSRSKAAFQEAAPKSIQTLHNALDNKRSTQAVQEIGKLTLLANSIGATRINTQALRIKGYVEVGDWEEATASLEKLNAHLAHAIEQLQ